MDCQTAATRLGAWIDGELSPDEVAALDTHLAGCDECRAAAEALRAQDADLVRVFEPRRAAAQRVAAAVVAELARERATETSPADYLRPAASPLARAPSEYGARWPGLVLAAAAGFILAIILFPPWKHSATDPVGPL